MEFGGSMVIQDDLMDGANFIHHALVVAVALDRSPGFDIAAHQDVQFYFFLLFGGQAKKIFMFEQELSVPSVLSEGPAS